jgi:hypothetical protein
VAYPQLFEVFHLEPDIFCSAHENEAEKYTTETDKKVVRKRGRPSKLLVQ